MLNPVTVTVPQPVRALGVADTRRSATAVLKTRLLQRTVSLREILEDPPGELRSYMIWEVLLWAPGIGPMRLRALNVQAVRHGHVGVAILAFLAGRGEYPVLGSTHIPRSPPGSALSLASGAPF